ncbi:MAG: MFS transporter [Actinomyces sp.]|uniref:MFS transporter n=1 Tax=Actinomyces sp. TaxID=29317 RepID=UPI0026DD98E9|nr:MFS transporter [Actinomyces sp.]MDO4242686.1 MFS transporter [Actinomyces sp.]
MTSPPPEPGQPGPGAPPPSPRTLLTAPVGHLALAMLVIELLAGMQIYINQTVLPLLASDLGARQHYGLITAAAMVPTFLTMPLGGSMLVRWRADRLMSALTAVLVAGAGLGALAPNVGLYVLGEILRGLAAGALATVTMGVMVVALPESWRRLLLATGSAMWVVSSLLGPVYAAGVAQAWSWRWALVGYVPLLVVARGVMARQVRSLRVPDDDRRPPVLPALAMAGGVAVIGAVPAASVWFWPVGAAGAVAVVWACARVFPVGVLRLAPGRPAALATLGWLCAAYFALDYLVSPAGHDVLGLGPAAIGWALTMAGVCWSVVAMWCGAHPAREAGAYRLRTALGGAGLTVGGAVVALALGSAVPWWGLHVGCALAGLGMGATHQDTVIRCLTAPSELGAPDDGIPATQAATAVTIAGGAGGATLGTLVTSFVAPTGAGVEAGRVVPVCAVLAVMLAATPLLARRTEPGNLQS